MMFAGVGALQVDRGGGRNVSGWEGLGEEESGKRKHEEGRGRRSAVVGTWESRACLLPGNHRQCVVSVWFVGPNKT